MKHPNFKHDKPHTEETKKILSQKTKLAWKNGLLKPHKHSEEAKLKMKVTNRGKNKHRENNYKHSKETRKKLSESLKGRKLSEETKKKIGDAHRGMKRSEEARENISKSLRGRPKYHKRGPNSSNWKGGITPLNNKIRACLEYVEWRRKIFRRDGWHCILCGDKPSGKYGIQADHFPIQFHKIMEKNKIKSLRSAIKCSELWDINNGRTLCQSCHDKTRK